MRSLQGAIFQCFPGFLAKIKSRSFLDPPYCLFLLLDANAFIYRMLGTPGMVSSLSIQDAKVGFVQLD